MANRALRVVAVVALAAGCALGATLGAQAPTASSDVLAALLVEVRGLRAAMEQMASAGPRIELALGRLQLQEQRVNNLLRRHTEVRERLATAERDAGTMTRELEAAQEFLLRPSLDEKEKQATQSHVTHFKQKLAEMQGDVQRLRAEEAEVAQLVATEQNRWSEINQQLEALEQSLARK